MDKELAQMKNKFTLQGTLVDNTVECKVDGQGRKYISGKLEVKTQEGFVVPVKVFCYELRSNGDKSALYDRALKIVDIPSARTVGVARAPKVSISNARIEDNSFYNVTDKRMVNTWEVTGTFINIASPDAADINDFEVEGIIASSPKEILDKEGNPTDKYQLKLLNVGFGGKVNELTFTYDDPTAVKYINENYNEGDKVTLCGQVVYEVSETRISKNLGFGQASDEVYTNTTRALKITAGTEPVSATEHNIKVKDLLQTVVKQNNTIKEKAEARAAATTTTQSSVNYSNLLF